MVPKDKVTRLRMKLAEGGLPKGGGVGYEIFDKSDALGTTSFVQNINHLRALEGELARTIRAIDRIQAARVHLVLPERPLFSRETPEPSASIVRARARRARAAADPRHPPPRRLRRQRPEAAAGVDRRRSRPTARRRRRRATPTTRVGDERRAGFEKRMRNQVEAIVSSVVGAGRARVQLSADFDYNKITQTSDKFDPEGRVLRSSQTREESSRHRRQRRPGHRQQRTAGQPEQGQPPAVARDQSKKSEEIINYEISRTTKTEVTEVGRVNRISVAVLVDGSYAKNEKGEMVYQDAQQGAARPHRGAGALGDRLRPEARRPGRGREPANSPKRRPSPPIAEPTGLLGMLQFTKDDVMYVIELGVMMLLGLVVLFMVIRPLVKRILASEEVARPAATARCRR